MWNESFDFTGTGGQKLAGLLQLPDGDPAAFALFAHCFTCGRDVKAAAQLARSLAEFGIATLRFDFTGLGSSGGEFARTTFSSNIADLVAAAGALRERHSAPSLLVGHSLGGAAVLAAAPLIPNQWQSPPLVHHSTRRMRCICSVTPWRRSSGRARRRSRSRAAASRSGATWCVTSRARTRRAGSESCGGRCWSCTRRATRPSASRTHPRSSRRRGIPRASSRWIRPTTY